MEIFDTILSNQVQRSGRLAPNIEKIRGDVMTNDLEKLQGTWHIDSLEIDGHVMTAAVLGGAKIVVEGDRFLSLGMGPEYEGNVELNESLQPKSFDLTFTRGPEKGNTNLGIYELDGDTWRICLAMRGTVRPKEFAAPAGTGIALEVLKRALT